MQTFGKIESFWFYQKTQKLLTKFPGLAISSHFGNVRCSLLGCSSLASDMEAKQTELDTESK